MRRTALGLALLILSACAGTVDLNKTLQPWIGATEQQLVARWGVPDTLYEYQGERQLVYRREITYPVSNGTITYRCFITMKVRANVVTSYTHEGDICDSASLWDDKAVN